MKTCKKCGIEKQEEDFYFQKNKILRIGTCKICHNEIMRRWQKENPDKAKKAWTKHNRKRSKGRICPNCGITFKIGSAQDGCSLKCRFYLSFQKSENGCWEWTKYKSGRKEMAYASLWVNGVRRFGSHISYELHKGEIKKGLMVLHTCDNSGCVNPDHLYLGTHQQNMDDMNSRGRGNKGRVHFKKYSIEQCEEVIKLRNLGKIHREISELTGVKESMCKFICKNPQRVNQGGNLL